MEAQLRNDTAVEDPVVSKAACSRSNSLLCCRIALTKPSNPLSHQYGISTSVMPRLVHSCETTKTNTDNFSRDNNQPTNNKTTKTKLKMIPPLCSGRAFAEATGL